MLNQNINIVLRTRNFWLGLEHQARENIFHNPKIIFLIFQIFMCWTYVCVY